jgi:tRNA A-37 threonylcarbamoyl transferase component Bud32
MFEPMKPSPEQWSRIKEIVADALEFATDAREQFIIEACQGDASLLEEVRSLLTDQRTVLHDPAAVHPPSLLSSIGPGSVLNGRYVVDNQLGKGGFATAWLALDQQLLNRRVVVKLLTTNASDPYIRQKFADELRALAALEHPNIIAPLDSGMTQDGMPFLVTQFAEGETLGAMMSEGPLPFKRAGRLLHQIGHTLAFIHASGIVHRDLKPENIIVQTFADGRDHARLIDFGISSIGVEAGSRATRIIGSLAYMAPEQLMGKVEPATDVYALGAMAFEMLTGSLPYPANNPVQLVMAQKKPPVHRPTGLRQELPPAVDRLILQALHSEPSQRPRDVARFSAELAGALEGIEPEVPRKGWSRAYISLAVVGAVLAVIFAAYRMESHRLPQRAEAVHAVPPAAPQIRSSAVTITVQQRSTDLPLIPSAAGDVYLANGSEFRLMAQSKKSGHLYLFSRDAQKGTVRVLFPSSTSETVGSLLGDEQTVRIPEDAWFHFEQKMLYPRGADESHDFLFIVWGSEALSDLEGGLVYANRKDKGLIPNGPLRVAIEKRLMGNYSPVEIRGTSLLLDLSGKDFTINRLKIRAKEKM